MSWRVVVISSRSKLDYKNSFLVVRNEDGEKRIFLDDISVLMCETTAISITAYLLTEMMARKIKVIFCDNFHNPMGELVPMNGGYVSSGKIRQQIRWNEKIKAEVWQNIVHHKILNQAKVLKRTERVGKLLQMEKLAGEVLPGDPTNREGVAAKIYFPDLFGAEFFRDSGDARNAALNYGYSVLLACFNREIAAVGYLTQIGVWHDSAENPFNLGSDLMESFRPIVDEFVATRKLETFSSEEKMELVNLLNVQIGIDDSKQYLNNAIGVYVRSVFSAIEEGEAGLIKNWYEL